MEPLPAVGKIVVISNGRWQENHHRERQACLVSRGPIVAPCTSASRGHRVSAMHMARDCPLPPAAWGLLGEAVMRRLEARFHPREDDRADYVIVGHLIWNAGRLDEFPRVEPASSLKQANAPGAILMTLRHLIRIKGLPSFQRLSSLLSMQWSFVEVTSPVEQDDAATAG